MKVLCLVGIAMLAIAAERSAFADECNSSKIEDLEKLTKKISDFKAGAPEQGSDGPQTSAMSKHTGNTGNATASGTKCAADLRVLKKKAEKLEKYFKSNCKTEKPEAEDDAKKAAANAESKAVTCESAAAQAKAQGDKSADNKDKMGEDKGKGGGDGKMPDMPKIPPQKKDPQGPDPAQVEAQRQARINSCKAAANTTLQSRESGCESQYSYDPNHAVASQLQLQNECKQNAIFASQTDINNCDAANPPGSTSSLPTAPDNFTSSVPTTSTTTH